MLLRRVLFGITIAVCIMLLHSTAHAQSATSQPAPQLISVPQPINPLTGPSFPCPQPSDPLAQLICSTPQLALLDMQFVQSYKALYQQVGVENEPALRHEDFEFDLAVRSHCNIAVSQGATQSSTPPPAAPANAAQCVLPLYQQQIAIWKARLQGAAAEEANRSIQQQVALQGRLQALGFLPAQAQLDGVFGTGTRAAIIQWQTSVGRQPTGLLGDADAQVLLADMPQSATSSSPNLPVQSQTQSPAPITPAEPNSSVETAWAPYTQYAACMLSKGFQLQTFVQDGVLPTDAIAASVLNSCIQAAASQTSVASSPIIAPQPTQSNIGGAPRSQRNSTPTTQQQNSASSWTFSFHNNTICQLVSPDENVYLMAGAYGQNRNIGRILLIKSSNLFQNETANLSFDDNTSLELASMDESPENQATLDKGGATYDLDDTDDDKLEAEIQASSDSSSFGVSIGNNSFAENMTGASAAFSQYHTCVNNLQTNVSTNDTNWSAQGNSSTPSLASWSVISKSGSCLLLASDKKIGFVYTGGITATMVEQSNLAADTPLTITFGDNTSLNVNTMNPTSANQQYTFYTLNSGDESNIVSEFQNSANTNTFTVSVGDISFTENMGGASSAIAQFSTCVSNLPASNSSDASTPPDSSSLQSNQPGSGSQTFTVTITCLINGNSGAGNCLLGSNNSPEDSDSGSITISDGTGNHNYGALDFLQAAGKIQLPLTQHFDIMAQEGAQGEPFQLEVQIQDSSGNVVYDDKTVSAYQTIHVTN